MQVNPLHLLGATLSTVVILAHSCTSPSTDLPRECARRAPAVARMLNIEWSIEEGARERLADFQREMQGCK